MPAVNEVIISPIMPNLEMSITLKGKPIAEVRRANFRLNLVCPWPFMTLPVHRLPAAVNR